MLCSTRRLLLAPSLLLLAFVGFSTDASQTKTSPKKIAQWVEQLGDNDFKVRERASKNLWEAGAAAEPFLEIAIYSNDAEVVRRARELLDKFRWGIYPDTPPEIVALIRAYQSSEGNPRMEVLQKLLSSGVAGQRAILKIAAAEKDENQRKVLGDLVAGKLPSAFLLAVTEEKYEQFESLLELGHEGKFIGNNQYAAYWLLRGKLAQRIALFHARLSEHPEDKWLAQTLTYLHRANGDLVAARKAAEKSGRADLLDGILLELGDWKSLVERSERTATQKANDIGTYHVVGAVNPAERWAYRAAFARLAGMQKEFENAVRELRKCPDGKQERDRLAFVAAKGLLLNDRPAEGLELLRTVPERRDLLFDIFCARLDFAAALDLAVKEDIHKKEIPSLELARARLLCWLGEKEGEALFDRYAEQIKDGVELRLVHSLLEEEMRAGLKDRAFAHAARAMNVAPPKHMKGLDQESAAQSYLAQLFPQQTKTSEVWWTVLRRQFTDDPPAATLKRLRELLEGKVAAKDVKKWIEQGEQLAPHGANAWARLDEWQQALAEPAISAGLDDLAISLLRKTDSVSSLFRLGDFFAAKKQWDRASEYYWRVWKKPLKREADRERSQAIAGEEAVDPWPLYLAGDALVRAGRNKEGTKLIEKAHWIPLADAALRYNFLRALIEHGHKDAARRERDLLLRISEPNTIPSGAAIRWLAFAALARKDYRKAAEGFEQSTLRCLNPNTNFVEHAAYVNVPAQIHQVRASGLLAAGKLAEALQQVELALAYSPGFADLPIALVPELKGRGYKKESIDLFNRCNETYEKVCRSYPRCAWAHNSSAWLSACCRRNLDQALQHAEKAVELAPAHAGYLDTLAEVHFQRGEKAKAVALQKRAIELNPKKTYYRKQLKRLEAGDPSAERPAENES